MSKIKDWLEPQALVLLEGWARDGLTDAQIAQNCGISQNMIYRWKRKYPELAEALRRGKEAVDYEVESAFLKRALGYEYTEVMDEETDTGHRRRETVKHVPPNVTAQVYWLKNRRPDKWRSNPEFQGNLCETGVIYLSPVQEDPTPAPVPEPGPEDNGSQPQREEILQ